MPPRALPIAVLFAWSAWSGAALAQQGPENALDQWRPSLAAAYQLVENNVPAALDEIRRLEATLPGRATASDHAHLLNVRARAENQLGLGEPAASHAQQALDIATRDNDKESQIEALLNIAVNSLILARLDVMETATTRSLELLEGVNRPDLLGEALLRASMMYHRFGQVDNSVNLAVKALEIARQSNNQRALTYAHQGLCILFSLNGRNPEAVDHCTRMLDHARATGSATLTAVALLALANISTQDKERLTREAILIFHSVGSTLNEAQARHGLAHFLHSGGRDTEALALFDQNHAFYEQSRHRIGLWFTLTARSNQLKAMGRTAAAKADAERAYAVAKEIGLPLYQRDSARQLATFASEAGDYRRAYQLSLAAEHTADEAARKNAGVHVLDLVQRYESEHKQRQINILHLLSERQAADIERERLRNRWLWTVLGATALMLAASAIYWLRLRQASTKLEMLAFALDFAGEAMYLIDGELRIIYANEEASRALGYSREELLTMSVPDFDADHGAASNREAILAIRDQIRAAGTQTITRRHRRKDGGTFPVEISNAAFTYRGVPAVISLARDISAANQAKCELEASRAQVRSLAARHEALREEERKHIAREVHDELGQLLTGLKLSLSRTLRRHRDSSRQLRDDVQDALSVTDMALRAARNITAMLRPAALDMGIGPALESLAAQFSASTGIRCNVHITEPEAELDGQRAIVLYRIAQESLTNIARHAHATLVHINLFSDDGQWVLKVNDNGVGFDVASAGADSFGLLGMRERALVLNGAVTITSSPGAGTDTSVRIPAQMQKEKP